jgi:hypothetical protein
VPAGATHDARAVQALATSNEIAPADRTLTDGEWADKDLALLTEALADAGTSGAELARVAGERSK